VQPALELSALCYLCENPCQRRVPKVLGDSLERIETLNQYLSSLINDMMLSERMEKGHIRMKEHLTDIRHTMQVLEHVFANHMQEKRLYFTVDTSKVTDSQVVCDEERLSRVILNLISNAYHYTEPGGGVMVTLIQKGPGYHLRKTENGRLAFKTYADYEFHVQDTGKWLSPEELEWITAPFEGEKTSQDLEEKGRGLHIAKNIIKLMGGQLSVTTEPGSGTEFVLHITLPLAPK
ncbi:MAG: HAMP domain-containing histidine kinase, partial [Selenomonadaceae bacterium]|nr:HAMP domain-containing histidine kinase [Selenomonadaceae bacterium]